jgi:catechol 2,3-dioxygenase
MNKPRAYLSHAVLQCVDFDAMLEFYTGVIGFHLSDIGEARSQRMAFLTLDPSLEHHQLALATGRKGIEGGGLHHLAFGVRSLAELNERHEHLKSRQVKGIELWTHASMLSVYYRDPENNRLEFFLETPYYVKQPIAETLDVDLAAPEEEVFRAIERKYGADPSFGRMSDWKMRAARQREKADT